MNSRETLLFDQQFEDLFVEELNWDRLSTRLNVSLAASGQFSKGWLSREERDRLSFARRIDYQLKGTARLGGQVVYVLDIPTASAFPDYLRRCSIGRRVSRNHHNPIIIYACRLEFDQVWQYVEFTKGELEFFEHRVDSHSDAVVLSERLSPIALTLEDRASDLSILDISDRVRRALTYRRKHRIYDRGQLVSELYEAFGQGLPELAELAQSERGLDRDEERTLFEMCQEGNQSARWQLVKSHLYLPMKIGLRYFRKFELEGLVDVADIISAGVVGLLKAVDRYRPDVSPRFVTYASLWVRREIGREAPNLGRHIDLPYHIDQRLSQVHERYEIELDRLTQKLKRNPTDLEIQNHLGMSDSEWSAFRLLEQRFASTDDASPIELSTDFDETDTTNRLVRCEELEAILASLTVREREVIRLRIGADVTLEEVGEVLGVSRERVRQIEMRAGKKLRHIGSELKAQGFSLTSGSSFSELAATWDSRQRRAMMRGPTKDPNRRPGYNFEGRPEDVSVVTQSGQVVEIIRGRIGPSLIDVPGVSTYYHQVAYETPSAYEDDSNCDQLDETHTLTSDLESTSTEPDAGPWPPAPGVIRKANEYIEHILDTYGSRYAPELLFHALRYYFPQSIITLDQIEDKFRRRGWTV